MAFQYRVVNFSDGFGVACCTDDFHARKIIVRSRDVVGGGTIREGALVECEIERLIERGRPAYRYSGKDIKVLK